jgi:cytoskeletal protein CcmA (bactofilin family)
MQNKERAMFGKSKDDSDQLPSALQQPQRSAAAPTTPAEPTSADEVSTIGRGVTVVGKIVGEGTVHLLGQIEGELRAWSVLINEGAKVEGDVVAEELTIGGFVKGIVHANRVKLNSSAVVEGDIFHKSLSIEENARFEGSSKREDNAANLTRTLTQRPTAAGDLHTKANAMSGSRKSNGAPSHDESRAVGTP